MHQQITFVDLKMNLLIRRRRVSTFIRILISASSMDVSLSLNGLGAKPLVRIADLADSKKYSAEEIDCRNKLASLYRLVDLFHWSQSIYNHITLRLPGKEHEILINPLGMIYREVTASSFVKISVDGRIVDPGSTPLGINQAGYILHTAIHEARPDVQCVLHLHTAAGAAVSAMKCGLLPLNQESMVIGPVAYHEYCGMLSAEDEKAEIVKHLEPDRNQQIKSFWVIFLRNHGFAACGASVEEALHLAYHALIACQTQKRAYDIAQHGANGMNRTASGQNGSMEHTYERMGDIEWAVGELEWEAWMRQLDGADYQTGHKYKMPALLEAIKKGK
uniref:Class II aldolase/adducin N-terminal domain-containing protein n=1 Tax=Globodera rostochiensis TaxID=31243 RepID=A0A914GPQ1_GLORO